MSIKDYRLATPYSSNDMEIVYSLDKFYYSAYINIEDGVYDVHKYEYPSKVTVKDYAIIKIEEFYANGKLFKLITLKDSNEIDIKTYNHDGFLIKNES